MSLTKRVRSLCQAVNTCVYPGVAAGISEAPPVTPPGGQLISHTLTRPSFGCLLVLAGSRDAPCGARTRALRTFCFYHFRSCYDHDNDICLPIASC